MRTADSRAVRELPIAGRESSVMRHPLLAVFLVAVALLPRSVAAHERASRSAADSLAGAEAPVRAPAAVLSNVQQSLGVMAGALEPSPESIRNLETALSAARGRPIAPGVLRTLAIDLSLALVRVDLYEEAAERLAQNLYSALNSRTLTSREVGLLVADTVTLLADVGAEPPAIERVTRALVAVCPVAPDTMPSSRDRAGPPVLTRG
jgi:hypothetical protein